MNFGPLQEITPQHLYILAYTLFDKGKPKHCITKEEPKSSWLLFDDWSICDLSMKDEDMPLIFSLNRPFILIL